MSDNQALDDSPISTLIQEAVDLKLEDHRPTLRVQRGQSVFYYNHRIKTTFVWVMDGGAPLTYYQCKVALEALAVEFEHHLDLDDFEGHVELSQGDRVKIRVLVERQDSIYLHLGIGMPVHFEGYFWPGRPLSHVGVAHVIDSAIGEDGNHNNVDLVPEGTSQRYTHTGVTIEIDCATAPGDPYAQFTYGELKTLMHSMLHWFIQLGQWGALDGVLTAQGIQTGLLSIEGRFEEPVQTVAASASSKATDVGAEDVAVS